MKREFELKEETLETVSGGMGGAIEHCTNRGAVTGMGSADVGGICGNNDMEIVDRPGYGRPGTAKRPG